ncbi:uncharacterized protein LOC112467658 [Temnothorax curvispinosus]|uniref:Uncharacterized protein LOC112467658 n=1 Tax=Temnothorax curvispinosus TaxID=300111 RepID=A0A6J1RHD4_9HYME|nr:uncharacterized protein LOC112467658 [Temnothorax curvispinosus]
MLPSKDLAICFLILWIFVNNAKCQDLKEMSKTLDEMLVNGRSFRRPRDYEDTSVIWQKNEFGAEAGNREEVVVTNISLHTLGDITEKIDISINNWQFLQTETSYFINAENSTLLFYKINLDDLSIERIISISTEGHILQFKVLHFNVEATFNENHASNLMAILLVESQYGYFLYWYKIFGNTYMLYSTLPVRKQIQDMEFVREENQYELLLLDNDDAYFKGQSLIDVYGFDIDYNNHRIDIWFCRRLFLPKVFNVQVCPVYGRIILAFQGIDNVVLYESKNEDKLCQFEKLEVIKSNKLANFACFESGYIEYLAIGGEELRLFHFFENNFQDNVETNLHFDKTTEILWIVTIPLNTYRDESLLLVQFNNLTVTALAWHGSKFKVVPLSNQILNNFDLSKIIVIPKVGFVHTNTLVRIDVTLKESAHPIHHETESVLKTRVLLEEVFRKQEAIFDETEARFNQSYFENPITTGFWNLSKVNVSNATIKTHVNYDAVKVGSINLEMKDISINVTSNLKKLEELETELDQILPNLKNVTNATRITLPSDIELTGDFLVNGTLYMKNIAAAFINNASTSIIANGITNHVIINGQKSFPSIDTNNLTILSLNGIPLEKIAFDFSIKNYSDVNFSKLKQLKIDGHLNFSKINSIKWKKLMQSIVWKDDSTIISGETIVEGLVAEEANVKNLNGLQYPENYVLLNEQFSINITGKKYFGNLSTTHLLDIEAINKIDIDDFIILSRHEAINKEITFENLEIDGIFQIDGNITGINMSNVENLLNETDSLVSDVIFENLTVVGNIVLKDSISAKVWSNLDDFLLKTEKDAVIIGNKIFWNDVNIKSHPIIKSRRINDHFFSEFVTTLSTNQQFPHLTKISANVMFGNVTLGTMKKLEDYVTHEQAIASGCLNKILLFIKSSVIDNLSFDTIKQTISQTTFFDKINKTFQQVYFENLTISTLLTDEVLPNTINGINYTDLAKRVLTLSTRQNLTGALKVDNLETDILDAEIINGIPLNTWNLLFTHAKSLYDDVFDGKSSITSLRVTGIITASTINNNDIIDIYEEDNMATVTFNKNVSIKNLRIRGFINNLNLSEFIADTVQKTDRNITFIDRKIFKNITCEFLEAQFINGHFVNDSLDPNEKQTLRGPIVINGSVTVFKNFNTTGKIGNSVFLNDFTDRFKTLEDSSYVLRGNFYFTETASVTKLNVSGSIQGSKLDSFLETTIFKNDANVTISGLKLFKNSVKFNGAFNIDGSLNDLDLHRFHENVVCIDKPFSIDTKVMFRKDVHLQKSLIVKTKLQAITIMGVDIKDLQENVIDLNKPKYFPARWTFDNVTFQTNIKIMQVNDLQMDLLILLNTQQFIMADKLNCTNIIVRNIQISGRINTYYIEDIYADTFMVYGNQNITGCIKIRGNVYAYHDFNAHLINNFNPTKIVSLTAIDTLTGNFMFKTPVVLNKSLRILGLLNRISPINWQGVAIKTTNEAKQIISGKWRVYGNVYFEAHVDGNEFLNKVNVIDISLTSAREHPEIDHVIEEAYEDLNNVCALHLDMLKCNAVNQIYKFHAFDYLKIQEFEGDIHDIRNVEVNDVDYILVNYNICHTTLLSYTQTDFQVIDKVSNFGLIDQWMFFKSNHVLYLLTIAKRSCGRSLNNIWKLENNRLMHVLELGNATDMNLYQDEFVAIIRENFEAKSENVTQPDVLKALISSKNEELNFVSNSNLIVLANQPLTYELQERSLNGTRIKNCLGCGSLLTFKVGIYGKEEYIHYDEEISQDYIYLCKNDISQTRILQTIKARRPKSLLILNFGGSVETLLVFVENNDIIQVYEYTGIEGFVHRNMIQIKIDKLYNFKVRKYNNLEKRHCLAVVHKNRLTILEAKMYGEKLDLRTLAMDSCYTNAC